MQVPISLWEKLSPWIFVAALLLLVVVLVPFIGKGVNGARRWIPLGIMSFQPSELTKLAIAMYAAGYMVRRMDVKENFVRAVVPMAISIAVVGLLLLAEPDMGAFLVIATIAMGILFLGGVNGRMFLLITAILIGAFVLMITFSEWRRERIFAYLNPWDEKYTLGKAYQLSHSLIAFGRGEIFGQGLGSSVEKLHYLPEAHTDFLLAVIGEELGFVGVACVIVAFFWLARRLFHIGRQAIALDRVFAGLLAQGIGIWVGGQAFINMGVNLGVLPTKGLTLPLMSYGGSAIVMNLVALAIVVRVDIENQAADARRPRMKHLLVMAAGTGGHVIPGLAVATEMQRRGWQVSWLGTQTGMENRLVPQAGIDARPDRLQRHARQGPARQRARRAAAARRLRRVLAPHLASPIRMRCSAWAATSAFPAAGWRGFTASLSSSSMPTRPCCSATAHCAGRRDASPSASPANRRRELGTKAIVTGNPVREQIEALPEPGAALRRPRRRAAPARRRWQPRRARPQRVRAAGDRPHDDRAASTRHAPDRRSGPPRRPRRLRRRRRRRRSAALHRRHGESARRVRRDRLPRRRDHRERAVRGRRRRRARALRGEHDLAPARQRGLDGGARGGASTCRRASCRPAASPTC